MIIAFKFFAIQHQLTRPEINKIMRYEMHHWSGSQRRKDLLNPFKLWILNVDGINPIDDFNLAV